MTPSLQILSAKPTPECGPSFSFRTFHIQEHDTDKFKEEEFNTFGGTTKVRSKVKLTFTEPGGTQAVCRV
jgi:hypothetical protein